MTRATQPSNKESTTTMSIENPKLDDSPIDLWVDAAHSYLRLKCKPDTKTRWPQEYVTIKTIVFAGAKELYNNYIRYEIVNSHRQHCKILRLYFVFDDDKEPPIDIIFDKSKEEHQGQTERTIRKERGEKDRVSLPERGRLMQPMLRAIKQSGATNFRIEIRGASRLKARGEESDKLDKRERSIFNRWMPDRKKATSGSTANPEDGKAHDTRIGD